MIHSTILRLTLTVITSIALAACGGSYEAERDHLDDGHHDFDTSTTLYSANIFDSYGTNSEFDDTPLAISPFIDDGLFEVFWDIESRTDYIIEVLINDNPYNLNNAATISYEYCGKGLACDSYQYQYCAYTPDFFVSCETPSGDIQGASINQFIPILPSTAYLTVRVCDTNLFHCSSESLPVTME